MPYLVNDKSTFIIEELYRGAKSKNNSFKLQRDIWLDFDGDGYSLFDSIKTDLNSPIRLESVGEFKLLSLSIDNKPQVLSTIKNNEKVGVELNRKNSLGYNLSKI